MTIIVFLLDTSASMAQRSYVGVSYLEFARQFVESFLKMRQRDVSCKTDRYMLMSYEDFPRNVKSGIENYGYGRYPSYSEPVVFVAVIDATSESSKKNFLSHNRFPRLSAPGSELTDEPFPLGSQTFRRLPQSSGPSITANYTACSSYKREESSECNKTEFLLSSNATNLDQVCSRWKAKTLTAGDHKQSSSIVCLKDPVISQVGRFPKPFWPEPSLNSLPPRKVYPELSFICSSAEPVTVTNVALDKYELEPCPLTQALVDRKDPNACWQVFVVNSSKQANGLGYPIGYLKLSNNLQTVNLFPLRKALNKIPIPHPFLNEQTSSPMFYQPGVVTQFKRWRDQGKEELEATCQQIAIFNNPNPANQEATRVFNIVCGVYQLPMVEVLPHLHIGSNETSKIGVLQNYQQRPSLYRDTRIAVTNTRYPKNPSTKFRNPFDIDREELLEQLEKMRVNLDLQISNRSIAALEGGMPGQRIRLQHAEDLHALPITKMGDYQEYNKRLNDIGKGPMRELEPQVAKAHAFGNPFKLDKKSMSVDEVGEMPVANTNGNSPGAASPTQEGIKKNEEMMLVWKRRCSSSSRESSPMPDSPPPAKRPHLDLDSIRSENRETMPINKNNVVNIDSPTATDISSPVANNIDIKSPQKDNNRPGAKDPRLQTADKTRQNGRNKKVDTAIKEASSSDDDDIKIIEEKVASPKTTSKSKKRTSHSPIASSSSSSDATVTSNGNGSVYDESEFPANLEFKRRVYPASALTESEDLPVLSKEEMIKRKFLVIRAIRHRGEHSSKYDPGKECVRLVNDLSWREQFDCLEYAHEQAKNFGLGSVTSWLNGELKRVAKCIRVKAQVNGTI
ncbi:VWFA domain-containing protein [Aphelenchoides bicaudatus]|nr:VWFA domain-containing protein [Aphelenchoides bicaudatus]